MGDFAGMDVSVKETSFSVWMKRARSREVKVTSEPEALLAVLKILPTNSSELAWKPAVVSVAVQRCRRSRVTCGLC